MPGTNALAVFESGATPATDPSNGQFFDLSGVPYFVNASGVATALTGGGSTTRAYFGDGSDGAAAFNGSAVTGTSGTGPYTLTRDVYYTTCTLSASTVVNTAGYRMFCTGTLTLNTSSVIQNNGAAASGATGGTGATEAFLGGTVTNPGATGPGGASTNGNNSTAMATAG